MTAYPSDRIAAWYQANTSDPDLYAARLIELFGGMDRFDEAPGHEKDQGKFHIYNAPSRRLDKGKLHVAAPAEIKDAQHFLFTGIDMSGRAYLAHYCGNITGAMVPISAPIATWHYRTSPRQRGEDIATMVHYEGHCSEEAM